jgi:hypothetical protein
MGTRLFRLRAARSAILLAAGLLAGCGGTAPSVVGVAPPTSRPITKAQTVAYAHDVNLRAGDVAGFTSNGSETEAPKPGRLGVEEIRCSGGVNPARPIAQVDSTEFTSEIERAFYGKTMKSTVEVWPTPVLVASNNSPSHRSRARARFVRFLEALHQRINLERKGRAQIGPFTISTLPTSLPGVSDSFLTSINETWLLRTGAIRAHVYRDIFGFISSAAEIELEATGAGHPVPAAIEEKALLLLLARARTNTV